MDETQQQTLLSFVRQTAKNHLSGKSLPTIPDINIDLQDFGGIFVTYKNQGKLRGGMGQFKPQTGVLETAQKISISSLQDMRFQNNPITLEELKAYNDKVKEGDIVFILPLPIEGLEASPLRVIAIRDVGVWGNLFGCSRGLLEKYGKARVKDTPISEAAITGCSNRRSATTIQ